MPIHKTAGGWQWGNHGKVYKSRKGAEKQAAAAHANGYHEDGLDEHTRMALDSLYSPPSKESK